METPMQMLEKANASNADLTAKIAVAEKARDEAIASMNAANIAHSEAIAVANVARAKAEADAKATADLAAKAESDRNAAQLELAKAKDELSGKNFAHVAGVAADKAAAVASGSGSDDSANQSQYKNKADALQAYNAISDYRQRADFRIKNKAILGL